MIWIFIDSTKNVDVKLDIGIMGEINVMGERCESPKSLFSVVNWYLEFMK